jgi:hypothetical protein
VAEILPRAYTGEAFCGYDAINVTLSMLERIFAMQDRVLNPRDRPECVGEVGMVHRRFLAAPARRGANQPAVPRRAMKAVDCRGQILRSLKLPQDDAAVAAHVRNVPEYRAQGDGMSHP